MKIKKGRQILLCVTILLTFFFTFTDSSFAEDLFKVTYEGTGTYTENCSSSDFNYVDNGTIFWKVIWPEVNLIPDNFDFYKTTNQNVNGTYDQKGACTDVNPGSFECKGTISTYSGWGVWDDTPIITVQPETSTRESTIVVEASISCDAQGTCTGGCEGDWFDDISDIPPFQTESIESGMKPTIVLSWSDVQTQDEIMEHVSSTTKLRNYCEPDSNIAERYIDWNGTITFEKLTNEELKAKPKVPSTVQRGESLTLDGTASTGNITSYEWSFKPMGFGSPQPNTQVTLQGETATVVLLKSMYVTLTVSDGKNTNKKTVPVNVESRSWKMPFEKSSNEGKIPDGSGGKPYYSSILESRCKMNIANCIKYFGGENVCAIDPPKTDNEPPHIIHPKKDSNNSWEDNGYELEQIQDGGPFNGWWYVKDQSIKVARQILINKYILPDGPVIFSGMDENFYNANVNGNYKAYLSGVRKHENTHTDRMKRAIAFYDPAKKIENLMGQDRDEIKQKADSIIQKSEDLMDKATSDCRMPVAWRGTILVPDDATYIWTPVGIVVGGRPPEGCN